MTRFAIQIDLVDGGTRHLFGSGDDGYREAVALRDGWRGEAPDRYWRYVEAGQHKVIYMREIRDVRVTEAS